MTRRSVKRVKGARKWTADSVGKMTKATKSNLKFAYDVAKPSSIKRNTVKVYKTAFDNTDKIIDRLLPGKGDILIAKGPITLVNKIGKRVVFHSLAQVKAAATAIKNSPATFKKSLNASIALAKLQLERIKDMTLQFQYKSYNYLLPYIEVAQKRSLTLVAAADKILMQYPMTKYVRNFAVTKYDGLVAPVLNRYLTAPAEKEAAASPAKSSR